jgi:hypothetical protein
MTLANGIKKKSVQTIEARSDVVTAAESCFPKYYALSTGK